MLYPLIFSLFFTSYAEASSCASCSSIQELQRESSKKVEALTQDKDFQNFQHQLMQAPEALLKKENLQQTVNHFIKNEDVFINRSPASDSENLYIFVSFSLGEKALLNLAKEAKLYNAVLVLRGFIEGSYAKTVRALEKIIQQTGEGFLIDPELFTLFSITAVPTFILSKPFRLNAQERTQTPLHDRLQGHVSISYVLESFAKEGDFKESAQALLKKGQAK